MLSKSTKQKVKYIQHALKEKIDLTKYVAKLSVDDMDAVIKIGPGVLKYMTDSHLYHIKQWIFHDYESFSYLKGLSDESIIELIECDDRIVYLIQDPSNNILSFIYEYEEYNGFKFNFSKRMRRKIISNYISGIDSDHRLLLWLSGLNDYTDYEKFYIQTIINKTRPSSGFFEIYMHIEMSHIIIASILTDGPAQKFEGGFDFDLEFKYLN